MLPVWRPMTWSVRACLVALPAFMLGLSTGVASAEAIRCPVVTDAAASIVYAADNPDGCPGAGKTINIQGRESMGLFAFDMVPAAGLTVEQAELYLKRADGEIVAVTVSTISAPWKPTSRTDAQFEEGSCGFSWRVWSEDPAKRRFWAAPGTQFTDAIFGQGGSMCAEVRVEITDDGWYRIPVPAEMVEAMAIGTQFGLSLYDTLGQRRVPGRVVSIEGGEPSYLLVTSSKLDGRIPAAVEDLEAKTDLEDPGQVLLTWKIPVATDRPIRGYKILYSKGQAEPKPVEAWHAIPLPGKPGQAQKMLIADAGLEPGTEYTFHVIAVGRTGQASGATTVTARASKGHPVPTLAIKMKTPVGATAASSSRPAVPRNPEPETRNPAVPRVWAAPETASVSPTTGNLLTAGVEPYIAGKPDVSHRLANEVWNAADQTVSLTAARNWFAAFQVVAELEGKGRKLLVEVDDLEGPQALPAARSVRIFRAWYVQGARGRQADAYFPDPLVPVAGAVELPAKDNGIEGQQNQAFFVDVYVPHNVQPGAYTTTLHVTDQNDPAYKADLKVKLAVAPVTLPDTLSFIPECNAYASPALKFKDVRAGTPRYLKIEREYHRLAHEHRCNLNILGYSQTGNTKDDYAPPVEGTGKDMKVADWTKFDEQFGPYLDGSAFADLPRGKVPVAAMYLPFFENYPCPVTMIKPEAQAMIMKYLSKPYLPDDAAEFIAKHYKGDMPIEDVFPDEYEDGCTAVARQFRDHFKQKSWTGTDFQVYLNNKYYWKERKPDQSGNASSWWLLDEPNHESDIQALAHFGRLFMKGLQGAEPVRAVYRGDISRISWVRDRLDDGLDMIAVSRRFDIAHAWLADKHERFGWQIWSYSGPFNSPAEPHTESRVWPLYSWLNGGHGLLFWQTLGDDRDFETANGEAMLLPGERFGIEGPIGTIRVKMWRAGQQDVELLHLLAKAPGWTRDRVCKSLVKSCAEAGLSKMLYRSPVTTACYVAEDAPAAFHDAVRRAVLDALAKAAKGSDDLTQ